MGESGGGVLREVREGGSETPQHQLRGLGKRCELPRWGPERGRGKLGFRSIFGPQKSCQNSQIMFFFTQLHKYKYNYKRIGVNVEILAY